MRVWRDVWPVLLVTVALCSPLAHGQDTEEQDVPLDELRLLMRQGAYTNVAEQARRALERAPAEPMLHALLGEALFALGDLDAAQQSFEHALSAAEAPPLEAAVNLANSLAYRGATDAAEPWYRRALSEYNRRFDLTSRELAAVAVAAQALARQQPALFHDAVRVYDEALTRDPSNVDARVALGELLLAKYNNTEALAVFRDALRRAPTHAGALLGLARSQHFDHDPASVATVRQSLAANPNLVAARTFLARLLVESEQYDEAAREAELALAINPNALDALAVLAAVHFLTNDTQRFTAVVERCLAINARYAELYNTLAELAVRNRLYHDAVDFAERAVEMDERSWRGYGLLGLNQLRIGAMERGRENLETAFAGDPFNVWIKNTLDLLDTLTDYEIVEGDRIALVLHRDEADLLAPYLLDLAEQARAYYSERYRHSIDETIRIELYPSHADFSVRTVGLAGIGLLGVAFGPVIALDSPSARPAGEFNWGSTVWHELAHTFHLHMSSHRVPRWFSEGLAVYEEQQARAGWGGDPTPSFLMAYRDGRLPPVSELNEGFVRPEYPEQIGHAYYLASLVFAYIDERWGSDVVPRMLRGYGDGESTAELFASLLQIQPAEFDTAFDSYVRGRFAHAFEALPTVAGPRAGDDAVSIDGPAADPGAFALAMRAAREALTAGDEAQAEAHLVRARDLFPEYAEADGPYWQLAELYQRRQELAAAVEQLERMTAINAEHLPSHLLLGRLRERLGDPAGAAEALAGAVYIHPYDPALHEQLARLYEGMGKWSDAVRARLAIIALRPVDMADARYRLARARLGAGDVTAARRELLRALELAPGFEQALELLLELRTAPTTTDSRPMNPWLPTAARELGAAAATTSRSAQTIPPHRSMT